MSTPETKTTKSKGSETGTFDAKTKDLLEKRFEAIAKVHEGKMEIAKLHGKLIQAGFNVIDSKCW